MRVCKEMAWVKTKKEVLLSLGENYKSPCSQYGLAVGFLARQHQVEPIWRANRIAAYERIRDQRSKGETDDFAAIPAMDLFY